MQTVNFPRRGLPVNYSTLYPETRSSQLSSTRSRAMMQRMLQEPFQTSKVWLLGDSFNRFIVFSLFSAMQTQTEVKQTPLNRSSIYGQLKDRQTRSYEPIAWLLQQPFHYYITNFIFYAGILQICMNVISILDCHKYNFANNARGCCLVVKCNSLYIILQRSFLQQLLSMHCETSYCQQQSDLQLQHRKTAFITDCTHTYTYTHCYALYTDTRNQPYCICA